MAHRSPLKAIENSPNKLLKHHARKPGYSPSKYDAIRSLDDDENWRERTEVVTKIQHDVKKEESKHPSTYRVTSEFLVESDSEYESATEFEEARSDFGNALSPPTLVMADTSATTPVAYSTLLNTTPSPPNTPERSEMFENSLLSSFEKMKLEETLTESKMDVDASFADTSRSKVNNSQESLSPAKCMPLSTLSENSAQIEERIEVIKSGVATMEEKLLEKVEATTTTHEVRTIKSSVDDQKDVKIPSKGYDFDILNQLDDANYNPFETKSAIANSHISDKNDTQLAVSLAKSDERTDEVDLKASITAMEEGVMKEDEIPTEGDATVLTASFMNEEVDEVSTKGYNLDILDQLDDATVNPFQTKSAVVNSPPGDKPLVDSSLGRRMKTEASICKMGENSIKINEIEASSEMTAEHSDASLEINEAMGTTDESKVTESSDVLEKNRIPTKTCNSDTVNELDGYSPFQTKVTVTNSPVKGDSNLPLEEELEKLDLETEIVSLEVHSVKMKSEHDDLVKVDMAIPKGNEVRRPETCAEEQEEIIIPTKGYNLDFLNDTNGAHFNPFHTKSTVLNSPVKHEPDILEKPDLKVEDPSSKASCNMIENVTKTNKFTSAEDEDTLKKNKVEQREGSKVPTKTHVVDILNELDSNINPFQTKSMVTNSLDKEDGTILSSADKLTKTDIMAEDAIIRSSDAVTSITGMENSSKENTSATLGEDGMAVEEQDEILVPTKGYDLNALNYLDDENFNPFQTKSAVVNSPVKEGIDPAVSFNSKMENVMPKKTCTPSSFGKELNTHINPVEADDTKVIGSTHDTVAKKSLDHCKPKTDQETLSITDEIVAANKDISGLSSEHFGEGGTAADKEGEGITVPGSLYDMNLLDKSNSDFDPFKTRATVVNSPCKGLEVNKDGTVVVFEQDTTKSDNMTEDSTMKCRASESVEKTDDPSINPFSTKSSVVNSPIKEKENVSNLKGQETTNKLKETEQSSCKEMIDDEIHKNKGKQDTLSMIEDSDQKLQSEKDSGTKGRTESDLKVGVSVTGEDVQMCVNPEDTEQRSTQTRNSNFGHLDKLNNPDYNPFETKSNICNSPKGEELPLSSEASAVKEEPEVSTKDCDKFKVPGNPKTGECILKDKDEQFHDASDVFMSTDVESAVALGERVVKGERDSLGTKGADESGQQDGTKFRECADFFNNEDELEMLGNAGGHNKVIAIRDSLFIKFDPLAAKRQSLDVRGSCLMSFSPSVSKPLDKEEEQVPVKAQVTSVANETLVDTSIMEATAVEDEGNQTVLSSGKTLNLLEMSICNQTVNARPMYTEQEMNEALKKQELLLQGVSMRRYQEFQQQMRVEKEEYLSKLIAVTKQDEQKTIIITGLEEEVKELQSDLEKMKKLLKDILCGQKNREAQHKKDIEDLTKKSQEKIKLAQETKTQQDSKLNQLQAECEKTDSAFFNLVKKYERTQAIVKGQKKNEEHMKAHIKDLELKITQNKEAFSEMLNVHEDKLKQAADQFEEMKTAHANEMGRAEVMLKRAEIKIINVKELLERSEKENQRLSAFVDDVTNKFK